MLDASNVTVRLSGDMLAAVDRIAASHPAREVRRISRPEVMREALAQFIAAHAAPARPRVRARNP